MVQKLTFALLVAANLPGFAQQPAGLFQDRNAGISFRYPSTWTLATRQPFQFPLLTSGPDKLPRALVFTRAVDGVAPWPATEFGGAAFGYDLKRAGSAEACRRIAFSKSKGVADHGKVTIQRIGYWHSITGDGGMSQYLKEDVYATYLRASNSCLLFDFGLFSVTAPGAAPPRALNVHEQSILRRTETDILSSIHVPSPSR